MGRLEKSTELDYDARHPIILPHDDDCVLDLILLLHVQHLHAGVEHVLGESRCQFWITKGRCLVSRMVKACVGCQRQFKAPQSQQMAPLPMERTTVCRPFENTGVDCFGPIKCKIVGVVNLYGDESSPL